MVEGTGKQSNFTPDESSPEWRFAEVEGASMCTESLSCKHSRLPAGRRASVHKNDLRSCASCSRGKRQCDGARPCGRCVAHGRTGTCTDAPTSSRSRKGCAASRRLKTSTRGEVYPPQLDNDHELTAYDTGDSPSYRLDGAESTVSECAEHSSMTSFSSFHNSESAGSEEQSLRINGERETLRDAGPQLSLKRKRNEGREVAGEEDALKSEILRSQPHMTVAITLPGHAPAPSSPIPVSVQQDERLCWSDAWAGLELGYELGTQGTPPHFRSMALRQSLELIDLGMPILDV